MTKDDYLLLVNILDYIRSSNDHVTACKTDRKALRALQRKLDRLTWKEDA